MESKNSHQTGVMNKNTFYFFVSDFISNFSTGFAFTILSWSTYTQTKSTAEVGLILTISILSGLAITPAAGFLSADCTRKNHIIKINLISAISISIAALFISYESTFLVSVYILSSIIGANFSMYNVLARPLIQTLAEKGQYVELCSYSEFILQAGTFLSSGIAGVIYNFFNMGLMLNLTSLMWLVSSLFLLKVSIAKRKTEKAGNNNLFFYLCGLRYLLKKKVLITLGVVLSIPFAVAIASNTLLPSYIKISLNQGSTVFGAADMFYGIGAALSAFMMLWLQKLVEKKKIIVILFAVSTGALFVISINIYVSFLFLSLLTLGFANSGLRIAINAYAMNIIPKNIYGPVNSVWTAFSYIIQIATINLISKIPGSSGLVYGYLMLAIIMLCGGVTFSLIVNTALFSRKTLA